MLARSIVSYFLIKIVKFYSHLNLKGFLNKKLGWNNKPNFNFLVTLIFLSSQYLIDSSLGDRWGIKFDHLSKLRIEISNQLYLTIRTNCCNYLGEAISTFLWLTDHQT